MPCNLCGNTNLRLLYKGTIGDKSVERFSQYAFYGDIYKCWECGFVQQKQEHDSSRIAEMLREEKYLDEEIGKLNMEEKGREFRQFLSYMERFCQIQNAAILDIGANTGVFLEECRRFTDNLTGIEPSREAVETCVNRGLTVFCTVLEKAPIPDGEKDIVTMWDVVEHLYDPLHDLERALNKLKPGGKIFISTHDIDGIFARLTGKKYPMLMYQHFFHFSPITLRRMLEKCGFRVLGCRHFCKSWSIGYLHQLLYKLWPENKMIGFVAKIIGPLASIKIVKSIRLTIPIPNFFVVTAERPG